MSGRLVFKVVPRGQARNYSGKYRELITAIIATVGTEDAVEVPTDAASVNRLRNAISISFARNRKDLRVRSRRNGPTTLFWAEQAGTELS